MTDDNTLKLLKRLSAKNDRLLAEIGDLKRSVASLEAKVDGFHGDLAKKSEKMSRAAARGPARGTGGWN
ncbi:MAG: hypothetical protein ACR2RE_12780 [Geminicoccaceae bacterium]